MTEQAAAYTLKEPINIHNHDNNENDDEGHDDISYDTKYDGEFKYDNTLHPRTARKQGCEEPEEEPLFSEDSDNEQYENDHDEH